MKILCISGAHRAVGKTTLARALRSRLPGTAEVLKIGHGRGKSKPERLFGEIEEALEYIRRRSSGRPGTGGKDIDYFILESNRFVGGSDLVIFLEPPPEPLFEAERQTESPSAAPARARADVRLSAADVEEGLRDPGAFRAAVDRRLGAVDSLDREERKAVVSALEHHVRSLGRFRDRAENEGKQEAAMGETAQGPPEVALRINGEAVPLNRFAQDIFGKAVIGMIGALKDVPAPRTVELEIRVL